MSLGRYFAASRYSPAHGKGRGHFRLRLPRDLSGHELAKLLRGYGYDIVRQSGSHLQLRSSIRGTNHQVTVPAHKSLRLGTLNSIISRVSDYTQIDRSRIVQELFHQ